MDWEDILDIIIVIFKYFFIGIYYLIIYTLPVGMIVLGVYAGVSAGTSFYDEDYYNWDYEQRMNQYQLSIIWQLPENIEYNKLPNKLITRTDLPYSLMSCDDFNTYGFSSNQYNSYYYDFTYYYSYDAEKNQITEFPDYSIDPIYMCFDKETLENYDYVLEGFYTNKEGGALIINAAGYGVTTINSNMTIYAVWSEKND